MAALACTCIATAVGTTTTAAAARAHSLKVVTTRTTSPLRTAIYDPYIFTGPQKAQGFGMLQAAGGSYARLVVNWNAVAPATVPDGFVASDPTSPGYDWGWLDSVVTAAEDAGLSPILDIQNPPSWGYKVAPTGYSAGTPSLSALGDFATALATHYDGSAAPAVQAFEVWNEPNLSLDLSPVSPATYRGMVNAVAASVHAVNAANLVVAGGMDPFGGSAARYHTMSPLKFMRGLLCLSSGPKPRKTCHTPVHFDVWSHHPYTFQGPDGHARNADDVSLGDLPKMQALLKAGVKLHQIVSRKPVQFWVTEFSWDTSPPRRHAAPPDLEARWTAEAFHQMWLSGVSLVTWFLIQDHGGTGPFQSGLYYHSSTLGQARAKPMLTSFRFPFVAYLGKNSSVSVWGRDVTSSAQTVTIQQQRGGKGSWATIARIKANKYGIFLANLKLKKVTAADRLRASAPGSGTSLSFSLTRPSARLRFGPWGNP